MAIQEIEKREIIGSVGLDKELNEAAKGMIMDIVQSQQYQKPIPSTVRELAANAVDAQSEKEKAILILSGKAKPEDYFIHRKESLYKDSNWDPSYYNLTYLDTTNNHVELIYKQGEGLGRCDKFIIKDYGVGLGKNRLQGSLSLGFSTKRNRIDALGSFGINTPVPLKSNF